MQGHIMFVSLLNSNGTYMSKFSNTLKQPSMQKLRLSDIDFSFQSTDQTTWMFWIFGGKGIFITPSPFIIQT